MRHLIPIIGTALILSSACGSAAEPAFVHARISFLLGTVYVKRSGTQLQAKLNAVLKDGDSLVTERESKAELTLNNADLVVIDESSRILFSSRVQNNTLETRIHISSGRVFSDIKRIVAGKRNSYSIVTATAVAAIRGTGFEVAVVPGGNTEVAVIEGIVNVRNPLFDGFVDVPADRFSLVGPDALPSAPARMGPDRLKRIESLIGEANMQRIIGRRTLKTGSLDGSAAPADERAAPPAAREGPYSLGKGYGFNFVDKDGDGINDNFIFETGGDIEGNDPSLPLTRFDLRDKIKGRNFHGKHDGPIPRDELKIER